MLDRPGAVQAELERLYSRADPEVDLARFLADQDIADDDALAEVIETDGRLRIARDLPVPLDRYLQAIPDLPRRDVPLDAAIDVTLRAMSKGAKGGRADHAAILTLIDQYPKFERAIREAGVLSDALISTAGLQAGMNDREVRPLPGEFGPGMPDGRARYELRELLGEGAFGQVYLAVDRQLSEPGHMALVAIKILSDRGRTPWARERLADEATKARRIDHPNVVRVVDRGVTAEDEDYIVHEYVSGGDLSDWMADQPGRVPPRRAAALVARLARGVQAAHSAGLVHCDLKPGNIMLTPDGEPKVADFGIAARLDELEAPDPDYDDDRPIGNLAFIAPEQYRREDGATSAPADIYALGGILFRLLTGMLPNGSTLEEIARTHDPEAGRRRPPVPSAFAPEVDRDLDLICGRAMAVDPQDRYPSAANLADDLEAWLRREPIAWTKPSTPRVIRLWMRRKPGLAAAVAVLIVSIIGGGQVVQYYLQQAKLANLELEKKENWETAFKAGLQEAVRRVRRSIAAGHRPSTEVMAGIWLLEDLLGSRIFGEPGQRTDYWDVRLEAIRNELQYAREQGDGDDFRSRILQTQLGVWLVFDREWQEAEPLLADTEAFWQRTLGHDDFWLTIMRIAREGAAVNRLAAASAIGPLTPDQQREAEGLEQDLVAAADEVGRRLPGSPVHYLTLSVLKTLYGPDMLDQPERESEVEKTIEKLLDPHGRRTDSNTTADAGRAPE